MSLRLKFAIMLWLLAAAVVVALGGAWWLFVSMQRDVRDPFQSMSTALDALGRSKSAVERMRVAVADPTRADPAKAPAWTAERVADFELAARDAAAPVAPGEDESADDWRVRTGTTAIRALRERLATAGRLGADYARAAAAGHPADREPARAALAEVHDLIERMERRIIEDTRRTVDFSDSARVSLGIVFGSAALVVVLCAAMGVILVRRWVLRPVDALRAATAALARGEFTHRVPLPPAAATAGDELVRLSAEVNQMAGMVKSMQDETVERERLAAVGEMVRRIVHNLRNPLAGIRGLAELTRSDLASGTDPHDLAEAQSRIIASVDRFEKWLTELLAATRPTQLLPENTRVEPWLSGLINAHAPQAASKGVSLDLDLNSAPDTAPFDARHLEHAVSAILSNAIEATSDPRLRVPGGPTGSVRVAAWAACPPAHKPGETWCITIVDDGPGIPESIRDQIFKPYFTTKRDGNGIGLAVAQQVVKAHGGALAVESPVSPDLQANPGRPGTRFTISLPLSRPQLADGGVGELASLGQDGAPVGQNPDHRR